jgi:hypothetical protein
VGLHPRMHIETSFDGPENELFPTDSDFFIVGPYISCTSFSVSNDHESLAAATAESCLTSTCWVFVPLEQPVNTAMKNTAMNRIDLGSSCM